MSGEPDGAGPTEGGASRATDSSIGGADAESVARIRDTPAYDRECRSFAWALTSDAPTDAVLDAYACAHDHPSFQRPASRIDRSLIRIGAGHPWLARIADAYSAVFVRKGLFRTKLVALLALLESGAPHSMRFEPETRSPVGAWLLLAVWGLEAMLALLLGIVIFGPIHLVSRLCGRAG